MIWIKPNNAPHPAASACKTFAILASIFTVHSLAHAQQTQPSAFHITTNDQAAAGLNLDAPGLESVKSALNAGQWETAKTAYLDYRRQKSSVRWTIMPSEKPEKPVAQTDAIGDEICNHIIRDRYYSMRQHQCDMGRDWNWLANPVKKGSPEYTEEWTWCVISRMEFWKNLADAYWKTHDEKYAREWVAQLQDFAAKCPAREPTYASEPSLWRTLDASARAGGSWPYAYAHFLNSPSITPDAHWTYFRLMYDHANILVSGLKNPNRTGNWVMAECSALYTIGVLFPEIKDAESWRKIALDRLLLELARTVPPDGYEVELTPMYHYFSLSSFATPMQLARMNNLPVPAEFQEKMLAMYRAPILVSDPMGYYVPTNDSGRYKVDGAAKKGIELFGPDPILLWAATGGKEGTAPPLSTMLPYAGFYAMRNGWKPNDLFLFFRGGPTGIGHQHEDMLQIVLAAGGRTLLFDPGTFSYDHSDWRRYVVNTPSHNTIIVDGKWQHRGPNSWPVTEPVKNPWITTPFFDFVSATYDGGYQKNEYDPNRQYSPEKWVGDLDRSITHTRRVLFLKPATVLIVDSLNGTGEHTFDAHFHLDAPDAQIDPKNQQIVSLFPDGTQLALTPLDRDNLTTEIIKGQTNPILGWFPGGSEPKRRPIPTIRFRKQQSAPATFATLLNPYTGSAPQIESQPVLSDPSIWTKKIQTDTETISILLPLNQTPSPLAVNLSSSDAIQTHAAGLVIRESNKSQMLTMGSWDTKDINMFNLKYELEQPGTILIIRQANQTCLMNAGPSDLSARFELPCQTRITLPTGQWFTLSRNGLSKMAPPI